MENNEANIKISLREGLFEISGSEKFVTEQISNFRETINLLLTQSQKSSLRDEHSDNAGIPGDASRGASDTSNPYENVLHFDGEEVKILKKMPGSNKSQKSVNTALVYLWGKKRIGIDSVKYNEIRTLCKNQGCLDSANFSAHMKSAREHIIVGGKRGTSSQSCELTVPGEAAAKELLDDINGK